MAVLQVRLGDARRELARGPACEPARLDEQLRAIARYSEEIGPALEVDRDARLLVLQRDMRAAAARALPGPSFGCDASRQAIDALAKACDACHQEFR